MDFSRGLVEEWLVSRIVAENWLVSAGVWKEVYLPSYI